MITLKQTLLDIKDDIPSDNRMLLSFIKSYLYSPRFRLLLNHRLGKYFFKKQNFFLRQIGVYYKKRMLLKRGCDISYNAFLGKNLKFPHPLGIVIGNGVIIEDNVMVFQQVTFGSHGKHGVVTKDYPIIKSGVKIFSGAKIIGSVTIGERAIIGANAVVNIDVPSDSVAVGIPCKILKK